MAKNALMVVEDDVDVAPEIDPKKLAKIIDKAREQLRCERRVEKLETELKTAKSELNAIKSVELPKMMKLAGLNHIPLGKGATLKIETIVTASIPSPYSTRAENAVERNAVGIAYMEKKAPSLIVNKVTMYFEKGFEKLYNKFLRDLKQRKVKVETEIERTIHGQTLGKWVREQDAKGIAVDDKALSVTRIDVAEIILPKKKTSVG